MREKELKKNMFIEKKMLYSPTIYRNLIYVHILMDNKVSASSSIRIQVGERFPPTNPPTPPTLCQTQDILTHFTSVYESRWSSNNENS